MDNETSVDATRNILNGEHQLAMLSNGTTDDDVTDTVDNTRRITIQRPVYTQARLDDDFGTLNQKKPAGGGCLSALRASCTCSASCLHSTLLQLFPFIGVMRNYEWKNWLAGDVISGLCVGVIHIPQSMGFSLLTSQGRIDSTTALALFFVPC